MNDWRTVASTDGSRAASVYGAAILRSAAGSGAAEAAAEVPGEDDADPDAAVVGAAETVEGSGVATFELALGEPVVPPAQAETSKATMRKIPARDGAGARGRVVGFIGPSCPTAAKRALRRAWSAGEIRDPDLADQQ
jgi:hypothetical protein